MTAKISVLNTELVTGHCPECHLDTILVGIQRSFYRCTNCGEDIEVLKDKVRANGSHK